MEISLGLILFICLPTWLLVMEQHALVVQGSGGCNRTCYSPQPHSPDPTENEMDEVLSIRCTIGCIQEHEIPVEVIGDDTAWPTITVSQLQNNCGLYQKVLQCRSACVTRFKDPTLTINRCRDQCYSACREECGGMTSCTRADSVCEQSCRKTYCRFGCQVYETIIRSDANLKPLSPVSAPILTPVQSSAGHFHIDVREATPLLNRNGQAEVVAYLFKVESHGGGHVGYYWQDDPQAPLDLSAFSCTQVSVSFAAINKYNTSNYSPKAEHCIHGVGGKPSQVDRSSISVQYTEDSRADFLGYAVANISWERPERYQFLTSYTIRILTQTAECGGLNVQYSYNNIRKEATNFILSTNRPNGLLKFGCSYQFSILALPADPDEVGAYRILSPALLDPPPQLSLHCSKLWDMTGYFNISVRWTIQNTSSSQRTLEAVKYFQLSPILKDTRYRGLLGIIQQYDLHTVLPKHGQMQYSVIMSHFQPQHTSTYKYRIELRTEKSERYFWRSVPRLQSCAIDSSSEPPTPVTSIEVTDLIFDRALGTLQMLVSWGPPEVANGEVVGYELQIVTRDTSTVEANTTIYRQTFPVNATSTLINASVEVNGSIHCLYIKGRVQNQFVFSEWSQPQIVPLDVECGTLNASNASIPDESGGQISVYFKRGNDTTKLLELDCGKTGVPSDLGSEGIYARLQRLEEQLELIAGQVDRPTTGPPLLERIDSIERKLDAITELLSSHIHK